MTAENGEERFQDFGNSRSWEDTIHFSEYEELGWSD